MAVASEYHTLPYYVPANLMCLTHLSGFFNAVNFWVMDTRARTWLYVKTQQSISCRNILSWVLEDVVIDDDDDTFRFNTAPVSRENSRSMVSNSSSQEDSLNEVSVDFSDSNIL